MDSPVRTMIFSYVKRSGSIQTNTAFCLLLLYVHFEGHHYLYIFVFTYILQQYSLQQKIICPVEENSFLQMLIC